MSFLIGFFVESERLFPVASVGDDGSRAAIFQPVPKLRAVIGFVAEELFRRRASADQAFRYRTIMRLAAGQEEGKKTAFSICDCVDLRIAPAT